MATTRTSQKSPVKRFRVVLEKYEKMDATSITIPFEVEKVFGTRARVPVRGTINGTPFRSSIFPQASGKHYMVIRKSLRDEAGVKAGETITVTMERDKEERTITPPEDLARALKNNKDARAAWDKLSFSHKREYAGAVEEAKKPETRQRRIEKTIEQLVAAKKVL